MAATSRSASEVSGAGCVQHARLRRSVVGVLGIGLLVAAWALFAPTAIGGPASYVVTDGTSMLPRFHADGLVITRKQAGYHVGEVVAYHNHQLHAVVMHRIAARDGDRFVFKGDNNDFRDRYHPTKADLVGREWVYLAGAGRYLLWLRDPMTFAVVVGLVALLSARPQRSSRRRRRHHAR